MKKNRYFLGLCFLIFSVGFLGIATSRVSSLNFTNNANGNSKVNLKELPYIAQEIAWDEDGNPVCQDSYWQGYIRSCSDGAGGVIVSWSDFRNGVDFDIYAQHIDSNGQPQWEENGTAITTENGYQANHRMCSDGSGGTIIAWKDERISAGEANIYAQRIDSNGTVKWDANGTAICTEVSIQANTAICSDENGGAIITWEDERDGDRDIYAKRVDSDGNVVWGDTNGLVICDEASDQLDPEICSDGNGGATIVWQDARDGWNLYAQYINLNGFEQWDTNGIPVCMADNSQFDPQIISNGVGSAIITWTDARSGVNYDIYAQSINSNGSLQWGENGTAISKASNVQKNPQLCSDGAEGAFITWLDERNGDGDIYTQHIDSDGDMQLTINGKAICDEDDDQQWPQICSDGGGGAIITWHDNRSLVDFDIYAQRINSSGIEKWDNDGIVICDEDEDQSYTVISSDGFGGAIIAWTDARDGLDIDIFAQKINNPAPTSNHPADITTSMEGTETINWILSDDSGGGKYRVLVNSTVLLDWTSWINATTLNIPINRTSTGFFEYTIEYYDDQNRSGVSDTVIVQITEKSSISGYSILILSLSVCMIGLTFAIRARKKKNIIY
ncbi:MAG: hypothetical protein ACFFCE_17515 [Promethearchaeota archaeon]